MDSLWGTWRRWNNITGWLLFLFSAIIYMLTLEPTVSFWDCGEFILSAFRLQVGHPPGAPLFLMVGRIATLFAGGDTSKVALMINILSAICSAFAILFLFIIQSRKTKPNRLMVFGNRASLTNVLGDGKMMEEVFY